MILSGSPTAAWLYKPRRFMYLNKYYFTLSWTNTEVHGKLISGITVYESRARVHAI